MGGVYNKSTTGDWSGGGPAEEPLVGRAEPFVKLNFLHIFGVFCTKMGQKLHI